MPYEISGGFAFYGQIPPGSNEQHLGIVLGVKEELLKYCYCTSKYKYITENEDFVKFPADRMKTFFRHPKDSFIFISPRHIIDILLITFTSRLADSEYEAKGQIDTDIFITILNKIQNSNNLSERFKRELFEFLE